MHEQTRENRKESPWTAWERAGQQTGRAGSVGACVTVGRAGCRAGLGLVGRHHAAGLVPVEGRAAQSLRDSGRTGINIRL